MPPSDFSGRAGRCGVHNWPFLCSGLPLSISAESAADGGGNARIVRELGIFQRDIEAGDGVEAGRRALPGRGSAAHRGAAGGVSAAALGALRGSFSRISAWTALFGFLFDLFGPVGDRAGQRRTRQSPAAALRQSRRAPAELPRRHNPSSGCRACDRVPSRPPPATSFGSFGHDPKYGASQAEWKVSVGRRREPEGDADSEGVRSPPATLRALCRCKGDVDDVHATLTLRQIGDPVWSGHWQEARHTVFAPAIPLGGLGMPLLTALALSIGILGGIATYLFAGPAAALGLQIWAAFVAWAAYYHSGGKEASLKSNIPAHIWGAILMDRLPRHQRVCAGPMGVLLAAGISRRRYRDRPGARRRHTALRLHSIGGPRLRLRRRLRPACRKAGHLDLGVAGRQSADQHHRVDDHRIAARLAVRKIGTALAAKGPRQPPDIKHAGRRGLPAGPHPTCRRRRTALVARVELSAVLQALLAAAPAEALAGGGATVRSVRLRRAGMSRRKWCGWFF